MKLKNVFEGLICVLMMPVLFGIAATEIISKLIIALVNHFGEFKW